MEFESQTCLQQPPVAAELCSTVSFPAVAMYVGPGRIATNMNFRSHLRFRRQLYTDVRHPPSFWKFPSQFSAVWQFQALWSRKDGYFLLEHCTLSSENLVGPLRRRGNLISPTLHPSFWDHTSSSSFLLFVALLCLWTVVFYILSKVYTWYCQEG